MIWAILFCALLAVLVAFQLALALGAPLGRFAWGGQHDGTLPTRLRIASAVSIALYLAMALVALARVGAISLIPAGVASVTMWVLVGYLGLGVLLNAISRSTAERTVMTPLAAGLALSALGVALS